VERRETKKEIKRGIDTTLARMRHFRSQGRDCRQVRYVMKMEKYGWEKIEKKKTLSEVTMYTGRRLKRKGYHIGYM